MGNSPVIFTEKINCQDCYKCIKVCPVKSIKVEDFSASVIEETCIYCGRCINACPAGAKKYRDDTAIVRGWVEKGEKVIACLAPSFLADFGEEKLDRLLKAFYCLGFSGVSETAIGADLVAEATNSFLETTDKEIVLATCCPSVVNYIKIYHPEFNGNLAPIVSPMIAHVRLLRANGFNAHKLVFAGPCISKKNEGDIYGNETDAVITFEELRNMFNEDGILFSDMDKVSLPDGFVIGSSERAGIFPVDSGMISTMCKDIKPVDAGFMSFSGMNSVMEVCGELDKWYPSRKVFIELMACEGGCIKGPATSKKEGVAYKRNKLLSEFDSFRRSGLAVPLEKKIIDLSFDHYKVPYKINCLYSDREIQEVLNSMGKTHKEDELNCSGCGYDNCRAYAVALLDGKAEKEMCISQMRKEAQNQASVLLRKMPYGVVLADENLRIVESNEKFVNQGGEELKMISEALGGLNGADLKKVFTYYKYFEAILESGDESCEHDLRDGSRNIKLSLISIQPHKLVCGIVQDMDDSTLQKEIISEKIREVLKHNAESVQRIAYILGESASYTESVLNMVVEKDKA
jgi:iron only hydrogenase large subunit-like protein